MVPLTDVGRCLETLTSKGHTLNTLLTPSHDVLGSDADVTVCIEQSIDYKMGGDKDDPSSPPPRELPPALKKRHLAQYMALWIKYLAWMAQPSCQAGLGLKKSM